jgi:hypothetical protein
MKRPINEVQKEATREYLWEKILEKKEFTSGEIYNVSMLERSTISEYLASLVVAGYLSVEKAKGKESKYKLIKPVSEPPRVREDGSRITAGMGRQNMWRTMRIRKIFTLNDLIALSSVDEHKIAEEEAKTYVSYLEKAGYLKKIDRLSMSKATFRFIRDTGPKSPMIQRVRRVYDPNLKQIVWPESEQPNNIKGV